MRKALLRIGLALALGGMAALALHAHADSDHVEGSSHHCCLCHTFAIGAAPVAISSISQPYIEKVPFTGVQVVAQAAPLFLNAPRPPPFA